MSRWNSEVLKADFEKIEGVESVEIGTPGGDVDTENITVNVKGVEDEAFYICGFSLDEAFMDIPWEQKGDIDVEFVELTDGMGSDGGIHSTNPVTITVYGQLMIALVKRGFTVVPYLKDYF